MDRTAVSSNGNCDCYEPTAKIDEVKKSSSNHKTYVFGWPCVRVRFKGGSDRGARCEENSNSRNRCHCYDSCRHTLSSPDRRVMGFGIPDTWVQQPVLIALKSPFKIENEKREEQYERVQPETHLHRQEELTPYNCVHHTSRCSLFVRLREAFHHCCEGCHHLCNCFHKRKIRKCPHCGCRVYKGEECVVCTISSKHSLESKTSEMHPTCIHYGVEQTAKSSHEERPKVKKNRTVCCVCRSKIKKALATDKATQTDKMLPPEKKLPPVEEEIIVCCKHRKCECSERSRKCPCCRRILKKGEECSRCREPPVQAPQTKTCVVHHHCYIDNKKRPATVTREKPPKDKKKVCCLCHCKMKQVKAKMVDVGTQTEDVYRPKKKKIPPSPAKKKKRITVCCKHGKKADDGSADQPKLMSEKQIFEALYRCWNDHTLTVSPDGVQNGAPYTSDISIPSKLNLRTCDSAESTLTLWSKASEFLMISPRERREPSRAENAAAEKEKGVENDAQTSGRMCGMSTKGCQTSFELLVHLVHTRRPEILRWFAETALREISSLDQRRTNKNHCQPHSE